MNITLTGRIDAIEFFEGKNYTVITTRAVDDYTAPSKYRLQSANPIGAIGQVIEANCELSGKVWLETYQDKKTGQQKSFNKNAVYMEVKSVSAPAYEKAKG
jgi:hypothetical protein